MLTQIDKMIQICETTKGTKYKLKSDWQGYQFTAQINGNYWFWLTTATGVETKKISTKFLKNIDNFLTNIIWPIDFIFVIWP